jgi:hypothetical protein
MDDKNRPHEIDMRVRAAASPPASVVDRVVMRALTDNDRSPEHGRRIRFAAVTAAMLALVLAVAAWQGRQRAAEDTPPTSLAITGNGSLLVVESQDGRRWVVGPAPKRRPGGGYVIVVPQ